MTHVGDLICGHLICGQRVSQIWYACTCVIAGFMSGKVRYGPQLTHYVTSILICALPSLLVLQHTSNNNTENTTTNDHGIDTNITDNQQQIEKLVISVILTNIKTKIVVTLLMTNNTSRVVVAVMVVVIPHRTIQLCCRSTTTVHRGSNCLSRTGVHHRNPSIS